MKVIDGEDRVISTVCLINLGDDFRKDYAAYRRAHTAEMP